MNFNIITILLAVALTASCSHLKKSNNQSSYKQNDVSRSVANQEKIDDLKIYEWKKMRAGSVTDTDENFESFKLFLDGSKYKRIEYSHSVTATVCGALNERYLKELIKRDVADLNGQCIKEAIIRNLTRPTQLIAFLKKQLDEGIISIESLSRGMEPFNPYGANGNYLYTNNKEFVYLDHTQLELIKFLHSYGLDINQIIRPWSSLLRWPTGPEDVDALNEYFKLGLSFKYNNLYLNKANLKYYTKDSIGRSYCYAVNIFDTNKALQDDIIKMSIPHFIEQFSFILDAMGETGEKYHALCRKNGLISGYQPVFSTMLQAVVSINNIRKANNLSSVTVKDFDKLVKLYTEKGMDINALLEGNYGGSVLHQLAKSYDSQFLKVLLNNGADINLRSAEDDNQTPLHFAAKFGRIEMVKALVDAGANVELRQDRRGKLFGKRPEHLAQENGHTEVYEYLKAHRLKNSKVKKFLDKFN